MAAPRRAWNDRTPANLEGAAAWQAHVILNDLVGNIRDAKGFGGCLLHMAGFAGEEPHIPSVVKMTVIDDTGALRLQLMEWAAMTRLVRIVVSHGDIIEDNPRQVLRELAASLD